MWWKAEPQTDAQRRREIARLEGVRDRMLDRAPMAFRFQQLIAPIMFAVYLLSFGATLFHRETVSVSFVIAAIVFGLVFGLLLCQSWLNRPGKGDRWGMADRLGYEGDSPRDIQKKIDALRAQLGADTPSKP